MSSREIYRALNCALITWRTNRTIGAQEPLDYLRERVRRSDLGEEEIKRRLTTHFVPFDELAVGGYDGLGQDEEMRDRVRWDYEAFLTKRAEMLMAPIEALCNGRRP